MPREKKSGQQRPPIMSEGQDPNSGAVAQPPKGSLDELQNLQDNAEQPKPELKPEPEKTPLARKNLGHAMAEPGTTSAAEHEKRHRAVFRSDKEREVGKYVFSNRSRNLLMLADLGFEDKKGTFTGLDFEPYQSRDLVAEGFNPDDILQSKDLRRLIQNGFLMLGPLKEGDKIPDNSVSAALGNFDISKGDVQVPVHSIYYDKFLEFCQKEERSFKNAEL